LVGGHVRYRRSKNWQSVVGTGPQTDPRSKRINNHGPLLTPLPFGWTRTITTAHRRVPPIVRLKLFGLPWSTYAAYGLNFAIAGYGVRRSRYFGRKYPRQTARDRVIRAASYYAQLNRQFDHHPRYPFWDPLHRTPVGPPAPEPDQDWSHWEDNPYQ
jgi:hypothetical protein